MGWLDPVNQGYFILVCVSLPLDTSFSKTKVVSEIYVFIISFANIVSEYEQVALELAITMVKENKERYLPRVFESTLCPEYEVGFHFWLCNTLMALHLVP